MQKIIFCEGLEIESLVLRIVSLTHRASPPLFFEPPFPPPPPWALLLADALVGSHHWPLQCSPPLACLDLSIL